MMSVCRRATARAQAISPEHGFWGWPKLAQALLCNGGMKRIFTATLFLSLLAIAPSTADAQLTVSISNITSSERNNDTDAGDPINSIECAESGSVNIELSITNTSVTTVFVWVGRSGADCQTTEARNTTEGTADCFEALSTGLVDNVSTITLQNLDVSDLDICDNTTQDGNQYELFIFDTEPTNSADVPAENYGSTTFTADVTAPDAPVVATGTTFAGSTNISVDLPKSDELNVDYRVYVDPDTSCATTPTADAGVDAATDAGTGGQPDLSGLASETSSNDDVSVSASQFGLNTAGDTATAYATILDVAGNESGASEAFCLEKVTTSGFCDASDSNGESCGGCAVSGAPLGSFRTGLIGVALLIGAGLIFRRRRR